MSAWHLLWIVPGVFALSFCLGAWLTRCKHKDIGAWPAEDKCSVCPFNPRPPNNEST